MIIGMVRGLVKRLIDSGITLSTAESVTGGLVAAKIVSVPGASKCFKGALVAYDNSVKGRLLNVRKRDLIRHGAVSAAVAKAMAVEGRKLFRTDLCLATTGIAGPTGATLTKPIGLSFIAVAYPKRVFVKKIRFHGSRNSIRNRLVKESILLL